MEWIQLLPNAMLVFCRITAFFVVVPAFSSRNVPLQFKIGLSLVITLIVFTALGLNNPVPMDGTYLLAIFREILVGITLGFVAYLFFTAVQIAGSFIDIQMGFGMANVIDPMTGASAPILGNFKYMIAILLFLSFNGHHMLLQAIMNSYDWVPLTNEALARIAEGQFSEWIVRSFTTMFGLAFQLAAPIAAALFLTDLGLGLLTRVAPQFNIFVVGAPFKMLLGFVLLLMLLPELGSMFEKVFTTMFTWMKNGLQLFSGS